MKKLFSPFAIVADWLQDHGYGGLVSSDGCKCTVEEMRIRGGPGCEGLDATDCKPGYDQGVMFFEGREIKRPLSTRRPAKDKKR